MSRSYLSFSILIVLIFLASCASSPESMVSAGNKFFDQGKYEDALLQYRRAMQKSPNYGDAYYRAGLAEVKLGRLGPALTAFDQAVQLTPQSTDAAASYGEVAVPAYLGDPTRPRRLYDRITRVADDLLKADPNSFAGLRMKGYLALADVRSEDAISFFRRALAIKPDHPEVSSALVQVYFYEGRNKEAEELANTLIARQKHFGPAYDLLYFHYLETGQAAAAEKILQSKVSSNPSSSVFAIQLARHYFRAKRMDLMASEISRLVSSQNPVPDGPMDAGDFYREIGRPEEALNAYRTGESLFPKQKVDYQKRQVALLISAGRKPEAEKVLDGILSANPKDADALASQAMLQLAGGEPEPATRALATLESLIKEHPSDSRYRLDYARALRVRDRDEDARLQLLELLRRDGTNREALRHVAEIYIRRRQVDEALRYADQLLALEPNTPSAVLVRTAALVARGQVSEAQAALTKLVRDFPDLREAQLQLGLLYVTQKRFPEAEALFAKYYRAGENDLRALRGLVEAYIAQNQSARAMSLLQEEVRRNPQSNNLRTVLASTAARVGNLDLAIAEYEKLAKVFTNSSEIYLQLGVLYSRKGDTQTALTYLQKGVETVPNNSEALASYAEALGQAGRLEEAKATYRRSLAIRSDNAAAMNNLAFLMAETNDNLDEALTMARAAAQKAPENLDFADTVGWIYLKRKNLDSAVLMFQNLVKRSPATALFRYHLGLALAAKGDRDAARAEFQSALKASPSASDAQRIREAIAKL
ncbi:MAG TPA: hypothetical protein DEH78_06815 [Solibacterales bacterium]|nr:hypothetical protein [Bryobacterales bacterium]